MFDAFVSSLDAALRELGVGDIVVGKRMRKLGAAFYGRVRAYEDALGADPVQEALPGLLARTVLEDQGAEKAAALAAYTVAAAGRLQRMALAELLEEGRAEWPPVTS